LERRTHCCKAAGTHGNGINSIVKVFKNTVLAAFFEPISGQNAIECRTLHIQSPKIFRGHTPRPSQNYARCLDPDTWIVRVPIVPVLRNDHWSPAMIGCIDAYILNHPRAQNQMSPAENEDHRANCACCARRSLRGHVGRCHPGYFDALRPSGGRGSASNSARVISRTSPPRS